MLKCYFDFSTPCISIFFIKHLIDLFICIEFLLMLLLPNMVSLHFPYRHDSKSLIEDNIIHKFAGYLLYMYIIV